MSDITGYDHVTAEAVATPPGACSIDGTCT
jgi:hypothetical protein